MTWIKKHLRKSFLSIIKQQWKIVRYPQGALAVLTPSEYFGYCKYEEVLYLKEELAKLRGNDAKINY